MSALCESGLQGDASRLKDMLQDFPHTVEILPVHSISTVLHLTKQLVDCRVQSEVASEENSIKGKPQGDRDANLFGGCRGNAWGGPSQGVGGKPRTNVY
jgi:hypothetical protein